MWRHYLRKIILNEDNKRQNTFAIMSIRRWMIPFHNNNYKVVPYGHLDTCHFQMSSPSVGIRCHFEFFSSTVHSHMASCYCITNIGQNKKNVSFYNYVLYILLVLMSFPILSDLCLFTTIHKQSLLLMLHAMVLLMEEKRKLLV